MCLLCFIDHLASALTVLLSGWSACRVRVLPSPTSAPRLTEQIAWLLKRCRGLWRSPHPPSRAPQMPRYSQPTRQPEGWGWKEKGQAWAPRWCSSCPAVLLPSPLTFLLSPSSPKKLDWEWNVRGRGGCKDEGEQDGCERVDWAWGGLEPEQSSECPSFCTVRGGVRRQHLSELCMWVYFFYIFAISSSRPFPRLKKNKKPQW